MNENLVFVLSIHSLNNWLLEFEYPSVIVFKASNPKFAMGLILRDLGNKIMSFRLKAAPRFAHVDVGKDLAGSYQDHMKPPPS